MVSKVQKILVVEDDQDIGAILKYILEDKGYEVNLLLYGRPVPETIIRFGPDLILMDIMLNDADGSEICKEVKKQYPTLPVILLSAGYYMHTNVLFGGADDFIVKPFDVNDVLLKVRTLLH